jgi:hypothetical protein
VKLRPGEHVVKTGHFMYDGRIPRPVRIVQTVMRPGSGDYEDAPEVAVDHPGTWFRIDLTAAGGPDFWASSIDGFKTVEAAVAHFSESVTWDA